MRDVHFIEASEAIWERDMTNNGCVVVNVGELMKKIRLWTGVYASYKLVGWYSFGGEAVEKHHMEFMGSLCAALPDQHLFFLKVNPHVDRDTADALPLALYSCSSSGSNAMQEVPFKVESSPMEGITVDTITKSCPPEGLSAVEVNNQEMIRALASFGRHVDVLVGVMEAMQSGRIPMQPDLLRQAKTICQHISSPVCPAEAATLLHQVCNNISEGAGGVGLGGAEELTTVMISFLSSVTKNLQSMNAVADVYKNVFGARGTMRGGVMLGAAKGGGGGGMMAGRSRGRGGGDGGEEIITEMEMGMRMHMEMMGGRINAHDSEIGNL